MKKFQFTTLFFLLLSLLLGGEAQTATPTLDASGLEKFYQSEATRLAALMQRVMVQANDLHPRYEKIAQFIAKRQAELKSKAGLKDFPLHAPPTALNQKSRVPVPVFSDEKHRFEELLKAKENQSPTHQQAINDLISYLAQLIQEEKR